jgi:hypothetical protein
MSALDTLPADQRAVLQLVLRQGRTYEQIASMLRMDPDTVAARAHAALDALGPEPSAALDAGRRAEIADYLLGQMSATGRRRVRDELEESAASRAWARTVRSELRPLGGDDLPEVPSEAAEVEEAFDALSARREAHARHERSSRTGGILLLAGLGLVLVLAVLFLTNVLGGDDEEGGGDQAGQQTQPQDVQPVAQANLTPVDGGGAPNGLGVAFVVSGQDQQAIRVDAERLPNVVRQPNPQEGACIFMVGGERSEFIGCFQEVDREGSASASGVLPADVRQFQQIVVTRETGRETPTQPGRVVLRGDIVAPTGNGGAGAPGQDQQGQGQQGQPAPPQDQQGQPAPPQDQQGEQGGG